LGVSILLGPHDDIVSEGLDVGRETWSEGVDGNESCVIQVNTWRGKIIVFDQIIWGPHSICNASFQKSKVW
jgi:hypothetical protein